jgi:hypothetical protein
MLRCRALFWFQSLVVLPGYIVRNIMHPEWHEHVILSRCALGGLICCMINCTSASKKEYHKNQSRSLEHPFCEKEGNWPAGVQRINRDRRCVFITVHRSHMTRHGWKAASYRHKCRRASTTQNYMLPSLTLSTRLPLHRYSLKFLAPNPQNI